ncbi:hypothetical protein HY946_02450, partial [Candidatus Gottesmanbacteria bacterium]|nr:hypothetical protein [Candidatus Gottesmanbacteria bacterium]
MLPFMKYKWLYAIISSLVLVPGIFSLVVWSLEPSIDFSGGTLMEIKNENKTRSEIATPANGGIKDKNDIEKIKNIADQNGFILASIQPSAENSYLLRMKPITQEQNENFKKALDKEFGKTQESRFETVGPILGQELL